MKIAYVITRADAVGGATVHVRDLARAMRARGDDATVLVGGTGPVTDQLTGAGVPFRSLRFLRRAVHPVADVRAVVELAGVLGELRPDLVSAHTAKAGWVGRAACARLGLPAVYTPHGWSIAGRVPPAQATIFRIAERVAARWAGAIVCVCEYERRLALARRVAPADRLVVVHNGVADIPAHLRANAAARPVRIVSVARFERPKDHPTLLRALARLTGLEWELELVGDGPLESQVRTLAADLGLAARVRFAGYQPEPALALARAQLFALASRSEAFPRSVLEALRAGLPVVASDVGGIAEAVDNEENGVLVTGRDAGAFAGALARLIQDAGRRERFGAAARLTYEAKFRLDSMVEHTSAVYDRVMGAYGCRRAEC